MNVGGINIQGLYYNVVITVLASPVTLDQDLSPLFSLLTDGSFWDGVVDRAQNFEWTKQQFFPGFKTLAAQLSDMGWEEAISVAVVLLAMWLAYVLLMNLFLPSPLHYQALLFPLFELAHEKWVGLFNKLRAWSFWRQVDSWLTSLEHAAWRRWVRLRLFGHSWNAPELVIVVLRDARMFSQADKQGLQELFALKRRSQTLLVLTHTSGLSHLVNCFLDVCNPVGAVSANFEIDEMWVIHGRSGTKIQVNKNMPQQADQPESADINSYLKTIAESLGWPAETSGNRWQEQLNTLKHERWVVRDILPALVIGSTPLTQMTLVKQDVSELEQYRDEFAAELKPHQQLFQDQASVSLNQKSVTETFACADRAKAILSTITRYRNDDYLFVFGRSGERKKLATALMHCFADPLAAVKYLAKLIASGEIFNLMQLTRALTNQSWPGHRLPNLAELPIYVEAAWFLLQERLALQEDIALTRDRWLALQKQLETPGKLISTDNPLQSPVDASRTYCIHLAALKALGLLDAALCSAIEKDIEKRTMQFEQPSSQSIHTLFIDDVADTVRKLLLLDRISALKLLDSRFSSDWYHAPEEIKKIIKEITLKASNIMLRGVLKASNENELFKIVEIFNRPAVAVSTLSWLALQYLQAEYSGSQQHDKLLRLANFIIEFKPLLAESGDQAGAITAPTQFRPGQAKEIFDRVMDADFSSRLMTVIRQGHQHQAKLRQRIGDLRPMNLEGVTWGSYSEANELLVKLSDELHKLAVLA